MTDAEFERQFQAATKRGQDAQQNEPQAVAVKYEARRKSVAISLTNGCAVTIPVSLLEGLAGATAKQLGNVQTLGHGSAIQWPQLDQQFAVKSLMQGVFGFPAWMQKVASQNTAAAQLGRRGGSATSSAKAAAARANGAKGGRPKKTKVDVA